MSVQQALGIGKPDFDFTLEPGFIERGYLPCGSQSLTFSGQILLPGFFRLELGQVATICSPIVNVPWLWPGICGGTSGCRGVLARSTE